MRWSTVRGGRGRRVGSVLGAVATVALVASACAPASGHRTNWLGDERWDTAARANGTLVILGDSVGYGLTTVSGLTERMAFDAWGPLRSYTQVGLHSAPERAGDPDTVVRWIGEFRALGLNPRVTIVVAGANDVGYPGADNVERNKQRIQAALAALGNTQVVWTTIHHNRADLMTAWNRALWELDPLYPNLHVCDWAAEVVRNPQYLERDLVHMTVGVNGGYVAMREFVAACARSAV